MISDSSPGPVGGGRQAGRGGGHGQLCRFRPAETREPRCGGGGRRGRHGTGVGEGRDPVRAGGRRDVRDRRHPRRAQPGRRARPRHTRVGRLQGSSEMCAMIESEKDRP